MAKFKCERCGAAVEGKCKPKKCPVCNESSTMKEQDSCSCKCQKS